MKIIITDCSASSAMWIKEAVDNCPIDEVIYIEFESSGSEIPIDVTSHKRSEGIYIANCPDNKHWIPDVVKDLVLPYTMPSYEKEMKELDDIGLSLKEVPHYRDLEYRHKKKRF